MSSIQKKKITKHAKNQEKMIHNQGKKLIDTEPKL